MKSLNGNGFRYKKHHITIASIVLLGNYV